VLGSLVEAANTKKKDIRAQEKSNKIKISNCKNRESNWTVFGTVQTFCFNTENK
jgi:hypothetical protein